MLEKSRPPIAEQVGLLKDTHRYRRHAMKLQQKIDRSTESFVRVNATEWSPDLPEAEREKLNKQVKKIVDDARAGTCKIPRITQLVRDSDLCRAHADRMREQAEKEMEIIAKQLPVYAWWQTHTKSGLGLATIIAETGDLSNYSTPCKVWKRLGYAPYDGFAGSTWKRDSWRPRALKKEEWIENPFSGQKYALIKQIGEWLVNKQTLSAEKSGTEYGEPDGAYGRAYVERRKKTALAHPDWSKGHARADGIRVATKALLKDLWIAWNAADQVPFELQQAHVGGGAVDQPARELQGKPVRRAKSKKIEPNEFRRPKSK